MKNIFIILIFIFTLLGCKKQKSSSTKSLSGLYQRTVKNKGKSIAKVLIEYKNNKEVVFNISVGTEEGCTGELKGNLTINSANEATFSSEECEKLIFKFNKEQVEIIEENCFSSHGLKCSFNGTYLKE